MTAFGGMLACFLLLGLVAVPASSFQCPKKRSGLFPDSKDCGKFYQCYKGLRSFRLSCPPGLHFNSRTKRCDYPKRAKCQAESPSVTTRTTNFDDVSGFTCPKPFGLFPDEYNCSRFYQCAHGKAFIKVCPLQLNFNPKLKVCDFAESAGCVPLTTTTTSSTTTTGIETSSQPTEAISITAVQETSEAISNQSSTTPTVLTKSATNSTKIAISSTVKSSTTEATAKSTVSPATIPAAGPVDSSTKTPAAPVTTADSAIAVTEEEVEQSGDGGFQSGENSL